MSRKSNVMLERFFTALISGDRAAVREVFDELFEADVPAERIVDHLVWPALDQIQQRVGSDQLSHLSHHFATRLMRMMADQLQLRYTQQARRDQRVLVITGSDDAEELAGQLAADLLEADGYTVQYAGGGVANDEVVEQIGRADIDRLVVFGSTPSTVPATRQLIDRLHGMGVCPKMQIVVGGGVFNRAEGLAEEIGADLWASDPISLVKVMAENTQRRMSDDQRTVGRRRSKASKAA
ncbi:MAG: B12-binding domain-containing protein [Algisphaera sp.]